MTSKTSVCAIFVTYYPDQILFSEAIESIKSQVQKIIIIDNTELIENQTWLFDLAVIHDAHLLNLRKNIGLGAAHNYGIQWALSQKFEYVLILDQDSIPATDMVQMQLDSYEYLNSQNIPVAVIGPWLEGSKKLASFHFKSLIANNRVDLFLTDQPIPVDVVISSGSLIPANVILDVGGMNEELFIDNVDVDWCFRCAQMEYKAFIEPRAKMQHKLGDSVLKINFLIRTCSFVIQKPIRLYYSTRNRIWLYSARHAPWQWVLKDVIRLVGKACITLLYVKPRFKNLLMFYRGLIDGLSHRLGPKI